MKQLQKHWPVYTAISVLLLLMWLVLTIVLQSTHGKLIYAADDPYIGMATARNIAEHGVWGVTPYAYTASSSTLSWTLLLALTDLIAGPGEWAPFVWNLLFGIALLTASYAIAAHYKASPSTNFAMLLLIIFLLPLPTMVLLGMEHTLQCLLSVVVTFLAARYISGESPESAKRDQISLLVLAALVTTTRFEGMFLIAAVIAISLLTKRLLFALEMGICGFLPVLLNGLYSVRHGWFWLPASVLLKGSMPNAASLSGLISSTINHLFVNFRDGMHALVLVIAVLVVYIAAAGQGSLATESRQIAGAIIILMWAAHVQFVGPSSLYRYDAHLCAVSLVFLAAQVPVLVPDIPPLLSLSTWTSARNLASAALVVLLLFPAAVKGGRLLWFLPRCSINIFEQQYQMGLFAQKYYQGSAVALNDIGAVNYIADVHCLDLLGLANLDVAKARRQGTYVVPKMQEISGRFGTRLIIIYDEWFALGVPPEWVRVGRWTIPDNVVAGSDTVSFYAANANEVPYLAQSLTDFSPHLPAEVIQRGR